MKPRPTPPPPSSSAPRTRPAHGSGVVWPSAFGFAGSAFAGSSGFAVFVGVVCAGFDFWQAGAPSIAPATTTVRQIVCAAFRFIGRREYVSLDGETSVVVP